MKKPRLTKTVADGLGVIASLARADMQADEKRDWGDAPRALEYLEQLRAWYRQKWCYRKDEKE